jgi:uncharacterized membrane protein required for colicin V production
MMGNGFSIPLSYDQLMLLVMALFMFVGASRGWRQEFISSCVLLTLTAILVEPSLAAKIIDYISKLTRLVLAFLKGFGSLDFGELEARYNATQVPFNGQNPYLLLIAVLLGFVFVSYNIQINTKGVTAFSRILGGLLGLLNGFVMVSLFRQYVLRYFERASPILWSQAGETPEVSVTLQNVPTGDILSGDRWQLVIVLLALMVGVLFVSMVTGNQIGKK